MSSTQSGEDVIRKAMVDADVVDCMVALPGQLFYSTQIPACLWFLARNKKPGGKMRDRRGEVLFIDARKLGSLVDRTRKEFSDADIARITGTYHAWREGMAPRPASTSARTALPQSEPITATCCCSTACVAPSPG
jgi:type I restriction enzyme M protein